MKQIIIRTLRNGVACVSVALLIGAGIMPMPAQADTIRGPTWVHTFSARHCPITSLNGGSVFLGPGRWVNPARVADSSGGMVQSIGSGDENARNATCLNVDYFTNAQSDACVSNAIWASAALTGGFIVAGSLAIATAGAATGGIGAIFAGAAVGVVGAAAGGWLY